MRDNIKHFPVNWVDGMKINKTLFITQDQASQDAVQDLATLHLSPIHYGILPADASGEGAFNVKISVDNQQTLRAAVQFCQAITSGGARINVPGLGIGTQLGPDGVPATSFQFSVGTEDIYWVFLVINPFDKQPAGSPDTDENPPRFPFVQPRYDVKVVSNADFKQFSNHPYALVIGKVLVNGNSISNDESYIPPSLTVSAHPDLITLYNEIDQFLSKLELKCSAIVQKIFKKSQQNELSDLVMYLCDRTMLYLGQTITQLRWFGMHSSPAVLLAHISSLARIMKNTIDLRIGSGKDELMNYLSEWCELKQGELESMLSGIANLRYDHNDINKNIDKVAHFVKIISKLFETLSNLEFIGKRKEIGFFVKEEQQVNNDTNGQKVKRRFFG